MWGVCGVAGIFSSFFTGLWFLAYFRSQFGPFSNPESEGNWLNGLENIRVHQLIVLSAGTMGAITLGKVGSIGLQFLYLTARMGIVQRRVESLAQHTKDRQYYWTMPVLNAMASEDRQNSFSGAALMRGPRRILICQASVGAGHKRAAEAIEVALNMECPGIEVKTIDVMDPQFADRVFTYFYKDFYLKLASGQSALGKMGNFCLGFMFDRTNEIQIGQLTGGGFLGNRRLCMSMVLNFLDFVCEFEPDIIVHTHFLAAEIIAGLRRHNSYTVPQVTVVTDMDVHAWWYQQPTEKYFVPRALAQYQLELHGVPAGDIQVTGIPILPCFEDSIRKVSNLSPAEKLLHFNDSMDCKVDLWESADDKRPVILLMSSGLGVTSLFLDLLKLEAPCIIAVVCGRQADIRSELEEFEVPKHIRVQFIGYTSTMHELMAVSDVIVTKPGGLITSEALACGMMLVIVDPYPGQEERNAAMLLEEGAAIQAHSHEVIAFRLDPILSNEQKLERYKRNAARLARPDAARRIARCIVQDNLAEAAAHADNDGPDTPTQPTQSSATRERSFSGQNKALGTERQRSTSCDSSCPPTPSRSRLSSPNLRPQVSPLSWFESTERNAHREDRGNQAKLIPIIQDFEP